MKKQAKQKKEQITIKQIKTDNKWKFILLTKEQVEADRSKAYKYLL